MAHVGTLTVSLVAQATAFEKTLRQAEKSLKSTARIFERQARLMERTGKSLMLSITAPLALIGAAASKAAIDWENAFAGVRDKVRATEEQYQELSKALRDMAYNDIPVAATELAGLAETAGTLGIQRPAILQFVRTMADLGATTKFSGEEAATALARFDNIMQSGQKSFDRMGSTIVALGGSLATTEGEIAEMALRLAGAGRVVGMAEHQVFALAGGLSSVGIEAQAGGTAMSKVMIQMADSVASGKKELSGIAKVAGMTAEQFKKSWQTDAAGAIVSFIEGLGDIRKSGGNVFAVLESLGMQEVRMRDALLRASGAGDLFRRSLNLGAKAWEENTALTEKAEIRFKTLAAQLKIARNRIKEVSITLGESLAPYINSVLDVLKPAIDQAKRMAEAFSKLNPILKTTIIMSILMVAAIGPAIWGYGRLLATTAAFQRALILLNGILGKVAFAFAAWRAGAATLGETLSFLVGGKIKLIILGIGALIVVTVLIIKYWDQLSAYARAAWGAVGAAALYGASLVVRGVGLILSAIGAIIPPFRGAAKAVMGAADSLKAAAASSMASAKSTVKSMKTIGSAAQSQADLAKSFRDIENSAKGAADMQDDLSDAVKGAGKAAGKNLQSFDEIHQLQEDLGSSGTDMPGLDMPALDFAGMGDFGDIFGLGDISAGVADLGDTLGEEFGKIAEKAGTAWKKLRDAMEPVNQAVQWIKDNWSTIGPIVEGIAGLLLLVMIPALIQTGVQAVISGAKVIASWIMQGWEAAASVAKQVTQMVIAGAKWVWLGAKATAGAIKVVAAWVIQGIQAAAAVAVQIAQFIIIGAKWVWLGITATANAVIMAAAWFIALGPIAWVTAAVIALAVLVIANWDWIKEKTIEIWGIVADWLSNKWDWIKETAGTAWEWIGRHIINPIQAVWDWLKDAWDKVGEWLSGKWDDIKAWSGDKWDNIKRNIIDPIRGAWDWLEDTWDEIARFLDRTWEGIKKTAEDVWRGVANTIIGMINRVISALNSFTRAMNKLSWDVPDWVPLIGGKRWGFDLPAITTIPQLAAGTNYVPKDMFAYLHKGEAVVPKDYNPSSSVRSSSTDLANTVAQAVYRAMMDAIRISQTSSSPHHTGDKQDIVLKIDSFVLARILLPALLREGQRQGVDLLVRPQGV